MDWLRLVAAGVLIPVFPLSLLFNGLISRVPSSLGQAVAMVALPLAGVGLLSSASGGRLPLVQGRGWTALVLVTAVLYAFRAVSVRDVTIWARLMGTSGLSLVWVISGQSHRLAPTALATLAWSTPAALLLIFAGVLAERTGGSYLGLQGGLARATPRLSGLLTVSALALVATPVFPSFFALLRVFGTLPVSWVWPVLALVLTWGWSIGAFLQRLLFGSYHGERIPDLGGVATSSGAVVLVVFAASAVMWSRAWIGI
jgi:NADH:ubiquinone oxidoreductase subunit 4 (subunit M)